jgi:hypothetical protein
MNEIESMIKKSNSFLWVEVGLDLLVSILFFNGWLVKASIGDVQVTEEEWNMLNTMMIVFGVIFIIILMVGVIIRLVNQDTKRVLAGVITILFVGGIFGIISGIYLFVINGRENAIKYRHRETNLTNNRGDYVILQVPRRADKLHDLILKNDSDLEKCLITSIDYEERKENILNLILKHKEELDSLAKRVVDAFNNRQISADQYQEYFSQINVERAKVNELLTLKSNN